MAKTRDWTEILVRRGVIGPDQLKEAAPDAERRPSRKPWSSWATPTSTTS